MIIIELENLDSEKEKDIPEKTSIKERISYGGKRTIEGISGFFSKKKDDKKTEDDVYEKLKKLSELKESGVISEYDYESKKAELLSKI